MDPREQILRQLNEATSSIRNSSDFEPEIGLVLGSGLANVGASLDIVATIPYNEIAHFPISTVSGHLGNLIFGKLGDSNLAVLQGRFHCYEGYTMWGITFPIRVLASLGIKILLITGACGSLNNKYKKGEAVLIKDHINMMPSNPLIGPHVPETGPRFVDMSEPYSLNLIKKAKKAASLGGFNLNSAIYAAVEGPSYETPAEAAMLKKLGADLVGMSIVPEVIVAKQIGLQVLGFGIVSNEHGKNKTISHDKVIKNVSKASKNFVTILQATIKEIARG